MCRAVRHQSDIDTFFADVMWVITVTLRIISGQLFAQDAGGLLGSRDVVYESCVVM